MPSLTVRKLGRDIIERLKARAKSNGRSLEAELREVLTKAAREGDQFNLREHAERIAAMARGRAQTDSTALLRRDRRR